MYFKIYRKHNLLFIISLFCFFSCSNLESENSLIVLDSYLKKPLAGINTAAAYMNIKNNSDKEMLVKGLSCNNFTAQMHETVIDDSGRVSMKRKEVLALRPNSEISLEPGKTHVMIMGKELSNEIKGINCDLIFESINSLPYSKRVPVFFEIRDLINER